MYSFYFFSFWLFLFFLLLPVSTIWTPIQFLLLSQQSKDGGLQAQKPHRCKLVETQRQSWQSTWSCCSLSRGTVIGLCHAGVSWPASHISPEAEGNHNPVHWQWRVNFFDEQSFSGTKQNSASPTFFSPCRTFKAIIFCYYHCKYCCYHVTSSCFCHEIKCEPVSKQRTQNIEIRSVL